MYNQFFFSFMVLQGKGYNLSSWTGFYSWAKITTENFLCRIIFEETFRFEKEKEFEYDDLTEGESFNAFSQHIDNPKIFIVLLIHQKSQHF